MKLLTKEILKAFKKQGDTSHKESKDIKIICKFFNPVGAATWWWFEYDAENRILTGIADLGFGCREIGSTSLDEIEAVTLPFGLKIERDRHYPVGEITAQEILEDAK